MMVDQSYLRFLTDTEDTATISAMCFIRLARFAPAILASAIVGCTNTSDPRILDAADSLVPQDSEVIGVTENTTGISFETGPYFVQYEITDGGVGSELADAIDQRAEAEGWERTSRHEAVGGTELRYRRDDLEAWITIWTTRDPVTATITVQRSE